MRLRTNVWVAAVAVCFGVLAGGCSSSKGGGEMRGGPEPLPAPGDARLMKHLSAKGDQIYTVTHAVGGALAWSPATPDAKLYDEAGTEVGRHVKGPMWVMSDGGSVTAQLPPVKVVSVDKTAVPWLELSAKAGTATGSLKDVRVIQRVKTAGGVPPAGELKEGNVGKEFRVPYTAQYLFYAKGE